MSLYRDIRSISPDLSTPDLLRFLIGEKFPGKTLVTASLKARSIAALKMIADVDPATPVVFCRRGYQFPESDSYRERIVGLLGLQNVSMAEESGAEVLPNDVDHSESMWVESQNGLGSIYEIVHLNQTLAPYSCWISAVYHVLRPPHVTQRVDVEGRMIRVDPLLRYSKDEIRAFMREHKLPFHPRASRPAPKPLTEPQEMPSSYNY